MTDRRADPVYGAVATALGTAAGGTLYVGYSGGLDSTVLLHALRSVTERRVVALHVNHGLHASAGAWQRHCAGVCRDWRVELISREVTLAGGNIEAAARDARYAFFEELLDAGDQLLLAHHQDDQAETVLLRLAQGRGLFGMPARRPLGRGELLRPLLGLPRALLAEYVRHHGLRWVEDPGNADLALDRNYLRARIMPALQARWPDVGRALQALLAQQRSIEEMLLAGMNGSSATLAVRDLRRGGSAVAAAELLRIWLLARHAVAPSGRALQNFVAQLDAPADRQPSLALNVGSLRRYRERIHHVLPPPQLESSYAVGLPGCLALPHGVVKIVDCASGGFVPTGAVRVVFRGDSAAAAGLLRHGHRRDLKTLLQQAAVPPWERAGYPLLVDADGVAAIPGIACRDSDPETRARRFEAHWLPLVH